MAGFFILTYFLKLENIWPKIGIRDIGHAFAINTVIFVPMAREVTDG